MIVGVFSPFDFLVIWIIALCYVFCPKSIIEKKNEYVKFFLIYLSLYFLLFLVLRYMLGTPQDYNIPGRSPRGLLRFLFALGFCPALFIANMIYPFKTVKRSQHLSFFTFLVSVLSVGIFVAMWVGAASSNM